MENKLGKMGVGFLFSWVEKAVLGMAVVRLLSGMLEITAAMAMVKLNQVEKALMVNSALAVVGPLVLLTTTAIGLLGMADRLSLAKVGFVFAGVGLILYGLRSG